LISFFLECKCISLVFPHQCSSALAVAANGERLSGGGFSLGETIHFGSIEFITDFFGNLSLPPRRDISDAAVMGSIHSGPPSPLRAMIGNYTEEFHTALDGKEGGGSTSPLQKAPAPATTISWPENTPNTQAMTIIPPQQVVPWPYTDFPFGRRHTHQERK
jgi:hypothetical protein